MTSQSEEIIGIKKKLEEADVEGSETLDMLRALNKIDMTKALLKATKIGVTINNIKKKTTTKSVAAMAESLVKDWKDKVAKENGGAYLFYSHFSSLRASLVPRHPHPHPMYCIMWGGISALGTPQRQRKHMPWCF